MQGETLMLRITDLPSPFLLLITSPAECDPRHVEFHCSHLCQQEPNVSRKRVFDLKWLHGGEMSWRLPLHSRAKRRERAT